MPRLASCRFAPWRVRPALFAALAVGALALWLADPAASRQPAGSPPMMPELPKAPAERWVNTAPLARADFAGEVVLIEVWTST